MYITNLATAVTVQGSSLNVYWEGLEEKAIFGSLFPRTLLTAMEKNLPDLILQLWRKINFSPQLQDQIWEWPGDEAISLVTVCAR